MKTNITKHIAGSLFLTVGLVALTPQDARSQVYMGGSIGGNYLHGKRTDSIKVNGILPEFKYSRKNLKELRPELNVFIGYICHLANSDNYVSVEPFLNIGHSKNKASSVILANTTGSFTQHAELRRQHGFGVVSKFGYKYNKIDSVYFIAGIQANKFKYSTTNIDTRNSASKTLPGVVVGFGMDKKLDNTTKIGFDVRYNFYKKLSLSKSKGAETVTLVTRPKAVTA